MQTQSPATAAPPTLQAELRRLRQLKAETLRDVQAATGISNAYLSQLETGRASEPSPRVLRALAAHYGTSYEHLMLLAGHLDALPQASVTLSPGVRWEDLSEEQRAALGELMQGAVRFVEQLKAKQGKATK